MPSELSTAVPDVGGGAWRGRDGIILGFVLLMSSMAALLSLPQASQERASQGRLEPMAILFPPWVSRGDAIARSFAAGHRVLRSGRWPSVVVVAPGTDAALVGMKPRSAVLLLLLAGLAGCLDAAVQPEASA